MAEKKALLVLADALDLNGSGEALDKLKKKAAVLRRRLRHRSRV